MKNSAQDRKPQDFYECSKGILCLGNAENIWNQDFEFYHASCKIIM